MRSESMMMSEVVDYWDRRPCNVRHSAAAVGSLAWSIEVSVRKYFIEPHILRFAQFARWSGKDVLEVGCGIGTDMLEFCRAGARVTAIDASQESVRIAMMRAEIHQEEATVIEVNAEDCLPCVANRYDLIYSFGVLHHTPRPQRILRNARAALKKDGELRVMVYSRWCLKRLLGEQPEAQANCPLARAYTMREARELIEGCGFRVESISKAHVFPYRIEDYVHYRYVKRWYYRLMPPKIFRWLERHFGEHTLIVARKA